MAKRVKPKVESQHKRQKSRSIPLEQVSPAVLTATRDVAYMLEQLSILPGPEDVLKACFRQGRASRGAGEWNYVV
jgi:hypothetical protein